MTDTVLVIAWLVLAHLVADFVLQNDWIAMNKGAGSRTGWAALGTHGFHVGLCLVPVIFAFGVPGIAYITLVVITHILVDRWKVMATRRAERNAQDAARTRLAATGDAPDSGLGSAWTPWPGMLFVADQVLHLTIAIVAWLVILEGVPLQQGFVDVREHDPARLGPGDGQRRCPDLRGAGLAVPGQHAGRVLLRARAGVTALGARRPRHACPGS